MARLSEKHGSEGPGWDPYSYSEWTFTSTDGLVTAVFHGGLAVWCKVTYDSPTFHKVQLRTEDEREAPRMWEAWTGLSIDKTEKVMHRIDHPRRCPKCGGLGRREADGYPGETFLLCTNCDQVVGSFFDESAII